MSKNFPKGKSKSNDKSIQWPNIWPNNNFSPLEDSFTTHEQILILLSLCKLFQKNTCNQL